MLHGIVIRNTGSHYLVRTDDGRSVPCKVKGNFRLKGIRSTNPVAVGDDMYCCHPINQHTTVTAMQTSVYVDMELPGTFAYDKLANDLKEAGATAEVK